MHTRRYASVLQVQRACVRDHSIVSELSLRCAWGRGAGGMPPWRRSCGSHGHSDDLGVRRSGVVRIRVLLGLDLGGVVLVCLGKLCWGDWLDAILEVEA